MKRAILMLAAAVLAAGCTPKGEPETQTVSFDEVLTSRRSIRDYDASKTISEAEVRALLEATQDAPSWANTQTTRYYVAMSPEKVAAAKELIGTGNAKNVAGAPVIVVSTFEKGRAGFFRGEPANEVGDGWGAYDNGLSNAYFILKARAMGFDTLIMGYRDAEALRELFQIPEQEELMAVISLGYRASDPQRPGRKPLDEVVKFF